MYQYLVEFRAEYYCQGYEWGTFQVLVYSNTFKEACLKIKKKKSEYYECNTAKDFKNLTLF